MLQNAQNGSGAYQADSMGTMGPFPGWGKWDGAKTTTNRHVVQKLWMGAATPSFHLYVLMAYKFIFSSKKCMQHHNDKHIRVNQKNKV